MFDIFGAQLKQEIQYEEQLQKSTLGGVLSIIVTITSLGYFIYIMDQWRSSNILPKSTNTLKAENYSSIQFNNEHLFELCYWKYSNEIIDPFRTTNNILMPIGIYIIGGIPQKPFSLLSNSSTLSTYGSNLLYVENLNIIQNSGFNPLLNETKEFLIVLTKCNKSLLSENQTCATDDEIDNFFLNQITLISFWINTKYFDPKNKNFDIVKKQYYLTFEKERGQQLQVILKQQKTKIDSGILFNNFEEDNYIFDAQFLTSTISLDFFEQIIHMDSFLTITIRLDPFSQDTQVVYPKLGEVLAQVGSIYLAYFYNDYILKCSLIETLLKSFIINYDSLKESQVKSNRVTINNLQKLAKQKLVFTNIINELARIELFLLSLFDNIQISKISQLKFQIKNEHKPESQEGIFSLIQNSNNNSNINVMSEEEFKELFYAFNINPSQEKRIMNVENIS